MKKIVIVGILACLLLAACGNVSQNSGETTDQTMKSTETMPISTTASTTNKPSTTSKPTTGSSSKPPAMILVRGKEQYELLKAAATDDIALEKYLLADSSTLMLNREDVLEFLKVLDSVPVLSVENAVDLSIDYTPSKDSLHFIYRFSTEEQAHWIRFEYWLDKEASAEWKESILKGSDIKEFDKIGKGKDIMCLQELKSAELSYRAIYCIEVDGMLISVHYKNIYTDVFQQKPSEVFAGVAVEESFDLAASKVNEKK